MATRSYEALNGLFRVLHLFTGGAANPGDGNPYVGSAVVAYDAIGNPVPMGSTGIDYSVNKPALPAVGAASFGGSTTMSAWVLLATIPGATTRTGVRVSATGGQAIAVIEDDGTAAVASTRVNATLDIIAGGAGLYSQGGSQYYDAAKGRIEIYGPSGAFVAVRSY